MRGCAVGEAEQMGANGVVPGSANPAWLAGSKRLDVGVGGNFFIRRRLGQNEFVGFGDA